MSVVKFRPFKIPTYTETAFFTAKTRKNEEYMLEDLARSGLTPDDILAYTQPQARLLDEAEAGYVIPYFGLDGQPLVDPNGFLIMSRTRNKVPPFSKIPRYIQPSDDQLRNYGLPASLPYFLPATLGKEHEKVYCAEGEKKTAAIYKFLDLPAFGIGGCWNWKNKGEEGGVHPWIVEFLKRCKAKHVTIVPDGDVFRYDICKAYGGFAKELESLGYEVSILHPPGKIDDLLVSWGPEAAANWEDIPRLSADALVQDPTQLSVKYSLAFREKDGKKIPHQHSSNIMRLLEEHPGFPTIWRNLDTNRVMIGEDVATPDLTEMQIANYFQHNLQFDKVHHRLIYTCIHALAKKNSRSPMLEWIQSQEWDGVARLDTWMIRLWGCEDTSFVREVSSKWLISSCARMQKPGTKIDWMLIVVGPQGTGKTSMPGIMFRNHALTLYGDHSDKDLHMLLHSALCVGFDELDSFGKRESSNLKAMITRNEDAFRPPYGASVEVFPRRFTLYGCGNRYEFLQHDPSGYRRYAIVEAPRLLNFSGLEGELSQLWAEAWTRFQSESNYWEIANASANADKYVVANPVEEQIRLALNRWADDKMQTHVKDGTIYFTMTHLLASMGMEGQARNTQLTREISAILRGLGAESRNGSAPTGTIRGRYYCIACQLC